MPDKSEKFQYNRLAELVLEHPLRFNWSLQGFGMLRFYVTQDIRVHVWDSRYRVGDVSGIHTHPWHFDSTVLCGQVKQYRYTRTGHHNAFTGSPKSKNFDEYRIRAGEGGGLEGDPMPVTLTPQWDYKNESGVEIIDAGGSYAQSYDEIHESFPVDGTVTIVHRKLADVRQPDHAFVYVPAGQEWISAEPRQAESLEVVVICNSALKAWF